MVEYHLFLLQTCRDRISSERKSYQVYPSAIYCTRGRIWKGDVLVADIEELEQVDAPEIHAERLNAKKVLTPMNGEKFFFLVADGTVKIFGEDQDLRTSTLIRDSPDRGEEQGNLLEESERVFFNAISRLVAV